MQLIIHKSMGHLKTAYGPRPPAKTFAFFFGSVSLSESRFFFPPSVSSSVVSFFPVFFHFCRQPFCPFLFCNAPVSPHASHHSAKRMCTSHTAHLAPSSDKAPSSKPHIYNMPRERGCFFFFSLSLSVPFSQRMSALPVAQQHAFGTSCVEAINSRASFLFCFRRNCFTISSCTSQKLYFGNFISIHSLGRARNGKKRVT